MSACIDYAAHVRFLQSEKQEAERMMANYPPGAPLREFFSGKSVALNDVIAALEESRGFPSMLPRLGNAPSVKEVESDS